MDEKNLPSLHIRRTKKNRLPNKDYGLPSLNIQGKKKRFQDESAQRRKNLSTLDFPCPYCGNVNPLEFTFGMKASDMLRNSYCIGCGKPFYPDLDIIIDDVEADDAKLEYSQTVISRKTPSSSSEYAPTYQKPERFQPQAGKWRLGRDIHTGDYVDAPQASRRQGLYITGIQGTGKSVLIENLIIQDIKQNMGVCLLDPHGDLTQAILSRLPDRREKDVIYLDITDYRYPFGINLFSCSNPSNPFEVQKIVDQVRHIFEKLLGVSQETQLILEYLYNCTSTLIANPGYTMADIPLLLQDGECRKKLVANVTDSEVQLFWRLHNQKKPADQYNDIASTLRRVRQLLQPISRPLVGQSTSTIDIRQVMDEGKILLVKLDATLESVTSLVGALIIALFLNAAISRADLPVHKRRQFNLYADEFQRFATDDFATLLEEARKFGIGITIAHQNGSQLETDLKERARSVANLVVFKVNSKDADELAGEYNITPQEAWVEELEEEWVEVIKPQRHERIEEQVALEVEEDVQAITTNPVDYLVSVRGSHGSRVVRELTQKILLPLDEEIRGARRYDEEEKRSRHYNPFETQRAEKKKKLINQLLVAAMEGEVQTTTEAFAERIEEIMKLTMTDANNYGYTWLVVGKRNFIRRLVLGKNDAERLVHIFVKEVLAQQVLALEPAAEPLNQNHYGVSWESFWQRFVQDAGQKTAEEFEQEYGYNVAMAFEQWWNKRKPIEEKVAWLVSYILNLITLCEELAKEPISVSTGHKRMVKRIQPHITYLTHEAEKITHPRKTILHPQRTYADMLNEVASELTNLPVFTARVKISTETGRAEHTIKTLDPKLENGKPLFGHGLQERKDRIKEQNIKDGYVKARTDVEAEILQRQKQCSEPPEDELPISRKPR